MERMHISEEKKSPSRYRNPPSYIFPKDSENNRAMSKHKEKSYHDHQQNIAKSQSYEGKKRYIEPIKDLKKNLHSGGLMRQQSERYRQGIDRIEYSINEYKKYNEKDQYERENLTDRQKYREIIENKKYRNAQDVRRAEVHQINDYKRDNRDYTSEDQFIRTIQRKPKMENYEPIEPSRNINEYRNPYREPESLPYRQSIESMIKSPVLKYKSKNAYKRRSPSPNEYHGKRSGRVYASVQKDSSPMSTMKRTSPKDRFQDAKEKFQAMEKIRLKEGGRLEQTRYGNNFSRDYSPEPIQQHWSSDDDEDFAPKNSDFRESKTRPSKSMGNLVNVKGYRHSYAEPNLKYCNRVGLAAIDPY
jgi:hypothetical protein